jgi:hypothetical protein
LSIFDPKKCYNPLSPPHSKDLSPPEYFLFPKLKMKLKGLHFADVAEIHEAVTDELTNWHTQPAVRQARRSKKGNFQQLFRNCTTTQKPVYMPVELILNKKKSKCLLHIFDLKKNWS